MSAGERALGLPGWLWLIDWARPRQGCEGQVVCASRAFGRGASPFQMAGEVFDSRSGRWSENGLDGIRFRVIAVCRTVTSREEVDPLNALNYVGAPTVFPVRAIDVGVAGSAEQGQIPKGQPPWHFTSETSFETVSSQSTFILDEITGVLWRSPVRNVGRTAVAGGALWRACTRRRRGLVASAHPQSVNTYGFTVADHRRARTW